MQADFCHGRLEVEAERQASILLAACESVPMTHLWSGRFDAPPDVEVFEFQASFKFDRRLFEDDVAGSLAWAEALAGAGVLSRSEATAIRMALTEMRDRGRADAGFVDGPDEDIHAFVERQLIERVGDAGKRLHTGRSRNEQVSLDLRLYLRRRIAVLQGELVELVDALAGRADAAGAALMPFRDAWVPEAVQGE